MAWHHFLYNIKVEGKRFTQYFIQSTYESHNFINDESENKNDTFESTKLRINEDIDVGTCSGVCLGAKSHDFRLSHKTFGWYKIVQIIPIGVWSSYYELSRIAYPLCRIIHYLKILLFSMIFRGEFDTLGNVSQACSPVYATLIVGLEGTIKSIRNLIIKECNCIQSFSCSKWYC